MAQDKSNNNSARPGSEGDEKTRLATNHGQSENTQTHFSAGNKLNAGAIVGDNYEIIELVGVGGMGYVYKVRHRILEKIYAMKTIASEQVSEMAWRRLQVEAQAIARINHPNIVGIHNLGLHQGKTPYYVMDYLKGENLAEILKRNRYMSLETSLPLFIEICKGLGYAHKKGIVHRDIKPGNIVILDQPDFSGARVKIVDFGIAKLAGTVDPDNQKLTTIGEVFGSPLYMSPEQCEGKRIDARSDIYSLGCTFFETLTGDTPFHGENPVATMLMHAQAEPPSLYEGCGLDFPESIEKLVAKMLAKAPMNRYPNLERVAEDLHNILEGKDIEDSSYTGHSSQSHRQSDGDRTTRERPAAQTRAIKAIKAIEKISPIRIALLAFILVFSLVSITLYFTNQRTIDNTTAVATKALVKNVVVLPVEKFSQLSGNDYIRFNFPEKQSLGTISTKNNDRTGKQAQSAVIFKRDSNLYFSPNDYAISHPEIFDSFRPDDLHAITTPQSSMVTDVDKAAQYTDVNLAIKHIAKLTGLKHLGLDVSNTSDAAIDDLNQLINLKVLRLNNTDVSGAGLSKLKRLKNLTYLSFGHNNDCKDMLKALAGSTALDSMYLQGQTIDEESAKLVASCKNLRHLDIEASSANDKVLAILADMPHIDYIGISACPMTEAGIAKVEKAHAGKKLHLVRSQNVQTTLDKSFGGENPADWFLTK